jgi:hypothetical protein
MEFRKRSVDPKPPKAKYELEVGKLLMCISEEQDGRLWQFAMFDQGEHTTRPIEECFEHWPDQVVGMLREMADKLEKIIEQERESKYETTVEGR